MKLNKYAYLIMLFIMLAPSILLMAQKNNLDFKAIIDKNLANESTMKKTINSQSVSKKVIKRRDMKVTEDNNYASLFVFMLMEFTIGGLTLLAFKRKIKLDSLKQARNIRKNVSVIRNERVITVTNKYADKVRKNLRYKQIGIQKNNIDITKTAKKNFISKGEVFLALNLNKLALKAK